MLRNVFLVSLLIYAVCAVHLEIREVGSAEEELGETHADSVTKRQVFDPMCSICIDTMESVRKNKPTPDEIKAVLNNICDSLPWGTQTMCKKLVPNNLNNLIKELMTGDVAKKICDKVHACKPEPPILITNSERE